MNQIYERIAKNPITTVMGVLSFVLTVCGVLAKQGITLGHVGTGTGVALIGSLASAFTALLARD